MASNSSYAIGIDLGTENTCSAIFRDDKAEIIPHDGQSLMPSYVAFTETGWLVGSAAKSQASLNPENTIFDALRFIGMKYSDPQVHSMIKDLPFRVAERGRRLAFVVHHRGTKLGLTPVEIIAMVLARAKRDAETYLGKGRPVSHAVITVPAYFSFCQRKAIRDAAIIAKLNPLRLINAPITACSDYVVTQRLAGERNILIADFGAGSFAISLATYEEGILEVRAVCGDSLLGGEDLDTRLVHYVVDIFKRKTGSDPTIIPRALRRLRTACEKAKCELTSQEQTRIELDQLYEGHDFAWTITRQNLEDCCTDLFRSLSQRVERALKDAKVAKEGTHTVIIIGGSSRIPKIQKLLYWFSMAKKSLALHAAILSGDTSSKSILEFMLLDVAPFSLDIETPGGVMSPLIPRNSSIPTKRSKTYTTSEDNQESFPVRVFEGERARTKDNWFLGNNVWVHAKDKGGNGKYGRMFLMHPDGIPKEELESMMTEAERFDAADKAEERRIEAKNALEEYISALLDSLASQPTTDAVSRNIRLANVLLEWLDENQGAQASEYHRRLLGAACPSCTRFYEL
ncbi:heat shock protein 70 [Trematosphaeria pertusa]|uniref:Heat shock protein 70 n=1 Tax=Trematosphaeria pertusa TaxID=390896 RepID=A0A6A6IXH5_9PLEO|nr:heat shock protein 70 [Trematosphaeria pertusa]KAF2255008.1 heat shock protein 70 [Trematosphaeria pertusa]